MTAPRTSPHIPHVPHDNQFSEHTLGRRVRLVRNLLPPIILLVVATVEGLLLLLPNAQLQFWGHMLFYGLVGPCVTFFTVDWIAKGMRAREHTEQKLRLLYIELHASHERLRGVQELMRSLAEAPDMEHALTAAARGAVRVTGATHAMVSIEEGLCATERGHTLLASPSADLQALRFSLAGRGELLLYFTMVPQPETQMLAEALAAEIANGLEATRQRTIDFLTLYSVDQSIRAERNMRKLLERVAEIMAQRLGASCRAVYLNDQDHTLRLEYMFQSLPTQMPSELTQLDHRQLNTQRQKTSPSPNSSSSPNSPSPSGAPATEFVQHVAVSDCPVLAHADAAQQIFPYAKAALGLPICDEQGLLGVLVLGDPDAAVIEQAQPRASLLAFMARQATLAIRNARAYSYSEELAISAERARIAREIHDGVAQSLAFVALRLDVISRQLDKDKHPIKQEITDVSQLLREQIREVRRSIFALRPTNLEQHGLLETMRLYVADFGQQNEIKTHLNIQGNIRLSATDEAVMFRILQESLNNIAKHAGAHEVSVTISEGQQIQLSIQDDGKGFDPSKASSHVSSVGGLGLVQMRERVEDRGGSLSIESTLGEGSTIQATLPQLEE